MDSGSAHDLPVRSAQPDDESRWQCAVNEGWPDTVAARTVHPPGAVAPVVALALPTNVVDMALWRHERAPHRRAAKGNYAGDDRTREPR